MVLQSDQKRPHAAQVICLHVCFSLRRNGNVSGIKKRPSARRPGPRANVARAPFEPNLKDTQDHHIHHIWNLVLQSSSCQRYWPIQTLFICSPSCRKKNAAVFNLPTRSERIFSQLRLFFFRFLTFLPQKAPLTAVIYSTRESHFCRWSSSSRNTSLNLIKPQNANGHI